MKHLRIYESDYIVDNNFTEKFEKFKESYNYEEISKKMSQYYFPEEFEYEFSILFFLYNTSRYNQSWKTGYKKVDDYVKRQVKKHVQELIQKKFQENPESFRKLKYWFIKRPKWSRTGSFQYIKEKIIHNIIFNFHTALKPFKRLSSNL